MSRPATLASVRETRDFSVLVRRRKDRSQRHLRPGLGLEEFFDELNRLGVCYVVLRSFESLPVVDPGRPIDILVADRDVSRLRPFLSSYIVAPGTQTFGVYSVSGLPGSDLHGVPYFSSAFAGGLLDRSVLLRGRYRVPSEQDHFDALAFHAVYHVGTDSGLPESASVKGSGDGGEYDYSTVLASLAERLSLSIPVTLEDLDAYLAGKGLRPPLDTLDKLSQSNSWLHGHVERLWGPVDAGMPGLTVFVLRQRAMHLLDRVCTELLREGFQPLETVHLAGDAAERARTETRGGNWGRGPWPVDGGAPGAYVIAYDLSRSLGEAALPSDPNRVSAAKQTIRQRLLNTRRPGEKLYNPLHSSDDPRQALDYLALLEDPGLMERLQRRIDDINQLMTMPYPLVEVLPSLQRRAVTTVVRHPQHGDCVCKLFYPSSGRFLARELRAMTEFADCPETPVLLERGENYLLTRRYTDTRQHVRRRLPGLRHVQLVPSASAALARLARDLHGRGAYLLDLSSQNLLTDPVEGLKVLDWEFLQSYQGARPRLVQSPTVLGRAPMEAGADLPVGVSTSTGGGELFRPLFTGVPKVVLLHVPAPLLPLLAEPGMCLLYGARLVRRAVLRVPQLGRSRGKRLVKTVLTALVSNAGNRG
jgi:hypothetical protein